MVIIFSVKGFIMKKHSLISKILWISFAVMLLLVLGVAITTVFTEYDGKANYFVFDAILAPLSLILGAICAACGVAAVCTTKCEDLSDMVFPANYHFPLTALGFFGATALLAMRSISMLGFVTVPFLIVACAYCILSGVQKQRTSNGKLPILGFFAVFGAILLNAYYYFDFTVEMNAPVKVVLQVGLLMLMLCYTGELRYLLGIQKPKMYLILSVFGLITSALASVPFFILFCKKSFLRIDYCASAFLLFTFFLTQIARIIYLLRGIKEDTEASEEPLDTEKSDTTRHSHR